MQLKKRLPQLSTLQAFVTIAETGSFTKTASALALTHSAISHQIRQLESHLGVRLLDRLASGVALTKAGELYLEEVKGALERLEYASSLLREDFDNRPLRISVLPSFAGSLLVPELLSFLEKNPEIHIEIDATAGTEKDLNTSIDLFIRYGMGDWPNYECEKLMDVNLFPVCSPEYLKKCGPINQIDDLRKSVLLRHTMEPWEPWLQANQEIGSQEKLSLLPSGPLYTDARVMQVAARDGQGVALVRDVLVESDLREGKLIRLLNKSTLSPKGYFAFYKSSTLLRPSFQIFLTWLRGVCLDLKPAK